MASAATPLIRGCQLGGATAAFLRRIARVHVSSLTRARWHALCSAPGPYMSLRSLSRSVVAPTLALSCFLAASSVAFPAHAQVTGLGVTVLNKDALPRLDANGNEITKRIDPASREGVNLTDCQGDQSISFPLAITGFAPGDVAEIWATNGSTDCTDPQFRPGTQSVHCFKVGTFSLMNTTTTTIKVKTLLSATGITTLDSFGCPSVDISTVTAYFMVFRGGVATIAAAKDTVPIKVDTQGPLPLTGIKALPGNAAITVSWDAVGEAGAQDIIGAQALCDPNPTQSTGATDAGTTQVCTEAEAGDPDADASETPEPTCTTAASEAGAAGGPIPTPAAIPSNGLACTTTAFASATAIGCGGISGTTGNTIRITDIAGKPLVNGTVYAVAVAGTDSFQNVGAVSSAICQFPELTTDFWTDYRNAGGQSGGCSVVEGVDGAGVPLGSFSLLMIGIVMTASTLRRLRRVQRSTRRTPPRRNDR
ncbi:MAG: hypothetical protein JWO86_1520 [Myxococcaceae bacterium]|nr:hypothetical protein [Myxococcaceae bacterium]